MPSNVLAVTSVQVATRTVTDSWAWYVIRASGLTSLGLLILLMASGIGQVTGWTYHILSPVKAWSVHKAMAIMLAVSVAIHMLGLLADHYVRFSLSQVLVPFLKTYSNGNKIFGIGYGWIAVPAGILAAYGVYIVTLSSLDSVGWIQNHKKLWKLTHLISYLTMFLVIIHALGAGTDFKETLWQLGAFSLLILLVIGTILRILRTNFLTKHKNS